MSLWIERVLNEFPADLARLWIAADPDDVLLDERILPVLRERGFTVLPFVDSVVFRAEYEEVYREAWDRGGQGASQALVLHLRSTLTEDLPWDYLRQARIVRLSLADLFPKFSYNVVRQIDAGHRESLFDAQSKHATQSLGEAATKEFILLHSFGVSPHLISRPEDFWSQLLRLHNRGLGLPAVLADHMALVLCGKSVFQGLPVAEWFTSKAVLLRVVQEAWYRYLERLGVTGTRVGEPVPGQSGIDVPFEHPEVRAAVHAMFLDGTLHPLAVQFMPIGLPDWLAVGMVQDPAALRNLVHDGLKSLIDAMPALDSTYRDWGEWARRFGEILSRCHRLDAAGEEAVKESLVEAQKLSDERLLAWVSRHYADLPSLPAAKAPVMVHHVPRFLSMRRNAGETKVALLVFDGLAFDQWVQIREHLAKQAAAFLFEESTCFAWLPTLTSISRQALFSGLRPREFADSIETTAQEPSLWSRFWQDQGLRANEVLYRKGIKRTDQLTELDGLLSNPATKAAGLVVDTIDEIVHGAVLGKRGIASQIDSWCDSGFVGRLFSLLLDRGFQVYLTADHGNVDATGVGRPNQGVIPETRGERVRVYRSASLLAEASSTFAGTARPGIAGLPVSFLPLFAGGRTAFATQGEPLVSHGGISVEELIVPFVKVSYAKDSLGADLNSSKAGSSGSAPPGGSQQ